MVPVLLFVLLAVAAMVAYPWLGAGVGVVLVVVILAASVRGRTRKSPPLERGTVWRSLERRVALRRAYEDLHGIEAASGLPPTPPDV